MGDRVLLIGPRDMAVFVHLDIQESIVKVRIE